MVAPFFCVHGGGVKESKNSKVQEFKSGDPSRARARSQDDNGLGECAE